MPDDADARRALAWLKAGQRTSEIAFDDAAPKQTTEELAKFRRVFYRRKNVGG